MKKVINMSEAKKYIAHSLEQTYSFASQLAKQLEQGSVITLEGELGTGKTAFTKGIAQGLDIKEPITSPTFTIIKEYQGTLPLYHMDAYRLEHSEEDIGNRKSTRLNSSHVANSYAVFCLKKKNKK